MKDREHTNLQDAIPGYGDLGWQTSDQQYNGEYHALGIKGEIDEDSLIILDEVDSVIPYRYDDLVPVILVPFKNELVDYTEVVTKTGLALDGRSTKLFADNRVKLFDNGTIEAPNRIARIMDQLGMLFDVKSAHQTDDQPAQSQPDYSQSMQDTFESFDRYGPIEHEPDLPVVVYSRMDNVVKSNGHNRPPLVRARQNPLTDGHGV